MLRNRRLSGANDGWCLLLPGSVARDFWRARQTLLCEAIRWWRSVAGRSAASDAARPSSARRTGPLAVMASIAAAAGAAGRGDDSSSSSTGGTANPGAKRARGLHPPEDPLAALTAAASEALLPPVATMAASVPSASAAAAAAPSAAAARATARPALASSAVARPPRRPTAGEARASTMAPASPLRLGGSSSSAAGAASPSRSSVLRSSSTTASQESKQRLLAVPARRSAAGGMLAAGQLQRAN